MNEPIKLITGKSDQELATDIKNKMEKILTELCSTMNEANENGLEVFYQTAKGPFGKNMITQIVVARHF